MILSPVAGRDELAHRDCTACFTGHRTLTKQQEAFITPQLDKVLQAAYRKGYRRFFSGGAIGFDLLAAERVSVLQSVHGDVKLVLALPCASQAQRFSEADALRYERVLYRSDETHVLSYHYYHGCMMVRNRYMVDRSSLCICYMDHMKGGTASTAAYAANKGLDVVNLAIPDICDMFIASGFAT